jgi:hypothetical protein
MTMMALILDAIKRHVPDEHTQRALGRELRAAVELDKPGERAGHAAPAPARTRLGRDKTR